MKTGILYEIINKSNNKKYVGVTETKLKNRWNVHLYKLRHNMLNSEMQKDFLLYGEKSFEIKELEKGNIDYLFLKEEEYTNSGKYEYNVIVGGNSRKSKLEALDCHIKRLKEDSEYKANFSENISRSLKGHKVSENSKLKMSFAKKGKKMSDSFKKERAIKYSGEGNPNAVYFLNLYTGVYYSSFDMQNYFSKHIGTIRKMFREQHYLLKDFVKC